IPTDIYFGYPSEDPLETGITQTQVRDWARLPVAVTPDSQAPTPGHCFLLRQAIRKNQVWRNSNMERQPPSQQLRLQALARDIVDIGQSPPVAVPALQVIHQFQSFPFVKKSVCGRASLNGQGFG